MKISRLIAVLAVTLLAATVNAADEGPHDKAIEARQAMMQVYKYYWFNLNQMAKGKAEYNAEAATIAADNLLASIRLNQTGMWPEGSHSKAAINRKNTTLPALWTASPKEIEKLDNAMTDAAIKMQAAAGNGLGELKKAVRAVNNGCKGCHDDFREKD